MRHIEANSFAELYSKVLNEVYLTPDYQTAPRGQKINECMNVVLTLNNPMSNLFKCDDKSLTLPTGYTKKEMILYLNAVKDCASFAKASPFWNTIKNSDGTINSAYGNLIFNSTTSDGRSQFDWAYESLVSDKDSRQAIMHFNRTDHQFAGVKDFPCTLCGIFHIRDNKLNLTIEMRSNDIVKGLIHDLPSFTMFQYLMYLRLKSTYENLEMGTYTHIANSLHVYETDFDICQKRCETELKPNSIPLPKNWECIKSNDLGMIMSMKIDRGVKTCVPYVDGIPYAEYPDNVEFYNWLLG